MAKKSTQIKKTDTKKIEFVTTGVLRLDEETGRITVDTTDYGVVELEPVIYEMELNNQVVEVKLTLKDELVDDVDYLTLS